MHIDTKSNMLILGSLLYAGGAAAAAVAAVVTPAVKAATTPKLSLTPEQSKILCIKGNIALAVLNWGGYESQALSFCSSYIKIPPVTTSVTTTQTSFVATTTTVPTTITTTVTLADAIVTVTTTETRPNPQRRDAAAVAVATPFAIWKSAIAAIAPQIVSAGCSCIQTKIPLATTTTTLTATTTQTTATITETSTSVVQTTTQSTTTTTTTSIAPECTLADIRGTQKVSGSPGCTYTFQGCQRQICNTPAAFGIFNLQDCIARCDLLPQAYAGSFDTEATRAGQTPCSCCQAQSFQQGTPSYNKGNIAFQIQRGSCGKQAAN